MSNILPGYLRITESLDHFQPEPIVAWKLRVGKVEANRVQKEALRIGTRLHEIIATGNYVADKKDKQEVKNCLGGFLKWRERNEAWNITPATRIYDNTLMLTGEGDFIWDHGIKTLVDMKCSKQISAHNFFQLGGYKRLGYAVDRLAILRLEKSMVDYQFVTNEDLGLTLDQCVDAYESSFKHYRYYTFIEEQLKEKL